MNFPIPFDAKQRAMTMAMAHVNTLQRTNKNLGDHPYANAFLRFFFGHGQPRKAELHFCVDDQSLTIPVIKQMINDLIETNGAVTSSLSRSFVLSLFPSLALAYETRLDNRFDMNQARDQKIDTVAAEDYEDRCAVEKNLIVSLSSDELVNWVQNSIWMKDHDLVFLLRLWHKEHDGCLIEFDEYYRYYSPLDIALSL